MTRASKIDLLILSDNPELLQTLQSAVGADRPVHHAVRLEEAVELATVEAIGVLVTDHPPAQLPALIEVLALRAPGLVTIAARPRDEATDLLRLAQQGTIYRFISLPQSGGQLRLFIDAAVRHYQEARVAEVELARGTRIAGHEGRRRSLRRPLAASAGLIALVAGGAFAAYQHFAGNPEMDIDTRLSVDAEAATPEHRAVAEPILRNPGRTGAAPDPDPAPGEDAPPTAAPDAAAPATVETLTAAGSAGGVAATTADQTSVELPAGPDALAPPSHNERTAPVNLAALVPGHPEPVAPEDAPPLQGAGSAARDTPGGDAPDNPGNDAPDDPDVNEIPGSTAADALVVVDAGDLGDAEYVGDIAEFDDIGLQLLVAQEEAAENQRLLELAQTRISEDRLLQPAQDSARYYLLVLLARAPRHPDLAAVQSRFSDALVGSALAALHRDQYDDARVYLDEAQALDSSAIGLQAAEMAYAKALEALQALQAQNSLARDETDRFSSAMPPRRLYIQPDYPRTAQRRGIQGRVELSFAINTDGGVDGITVETAEPPNVFERAAIDALKEWEFEVDSDAPERRYMVGIDFTLE